MMQTMTPVLDDNMKALKIACPGLLKKVEESISVNGRGQQFKEKCSRLETVLMPEARNAEIVVICGFESGLYARSVVSGTPESTFIVIVEEKPELFVQTISAYPVRDIILSQKVRFSVGEEPAAIREHIEGYSGFISFSRIMVLKDPESVNSDDSFYKKIEKSVNELKGVACLNRQTIEYFSEEWNRHILLNLRHIFSRKGVGRLFGKFSGVPGVVVSAGPSLDKNIKWLKRLGSNAVIISVDSAFKILVENGVSVHFVLCTDSQEKNFSHIEEVVKNPGESVLVVNPVTYPAIPDLFNGNVMLMTCNNPLMNWIESHAGVFGESLAGGSVSTSAFDFARKLGCSPVVISGQDLSYEFGRGYVTGSWHNSLFEKNIRHDNSMEMLNREYVHLNGIRKTKNIFLGQVRSTNEMLSWKSWYETVSSAENTINATEGGVSIDGFSCHSFHETAFSLLNREYPIKRMIRECLADENTTRADSLLNGLRKYRDSLSVVTEIVAKGLRCCSELSRQLKKGDVLRGDADRKLQVLHTFCSAVLEEETFIETNQWDINMILDRVPVKTGMNRGWEPGDRVDAYKLLFRAILALSKARAVDLEAGLEKVPGAFAKVKVQLL